VGQLVPHPDRWPKLYHLATHFLLGIGPKLLDAALEQPDVGSTEIFELSGLSQPLVTQLGERTTMGGGFLGD
jgi:hypothetical protein